MKRVTIVWIILGTLAFAYATYKWFKYQEIVTSGNYAHSNAIGILSNYLWQHGKLPCNQADFEIFAKQNDTIGNWEIEYIDNNSIPYYDYIRLHYRVKAGNKTCFLDELTFVIYLQGKVDRIYLTNYKPQEVYSYTHTRFGNNARTTANVIAKEILPWHYEQVLGFPASDVFTTSDLNAPLGFFIEKGDRLTVRVEHMGCVPSKLSRSYLDSLAAQVTLLAQDHSYKGKMFFRLNLATKEEIFSFDCP